MNKKTFGSVKNFSGCLKNLNFKTTLKPHEMAHCIRNVTGIFQKNRLRSSLNMKKNDQIFENIGMFFTVFQSKSSGTISIQDFNSEFPDKK